MLTFSEFRKQTEEFEHESGQIYTRKQIREMYNEYSRFCKDILAPKEECTQLTPKLDVQDGVGMVVFKQEEGIIPMNFSNPTIKAATANAGAGVIINAPAEMDTAEEQRKYLGRRALDTISDKIAELRQKFKLNFDYRPKTVKEAQDRLKAGLFTVKGNDDAADGGRYYSLNEHFSWRGPDDQADRKGYEEAVAKFGDHYAPLLDEIRIFDPKDALESLRKIEAYAV